MSLQVHGMTRAGLGYALPYPKPYPGGGRQGYARAGQTARARDNLRWGADYLMRTISRPASGTSRYQDFYIAYQACPSPTMQSSVGIPQRPQTQSAMVHKVFPPQLYFFLRSLCFVASLLC